MSDDNVIEARGLLKLYGSARAVDAIDLSIRTGEIFGLLGPNGAGKTTTILMMLGLTETSGGTVDVLGFDPVRQPLEVKRRVGYLPDAVGFYDHLTARENLLYTARLLDIPRRETDRRIMEALGAVQLADVADKRVATYSRGMRQRLGIAEIVMKKAEVAILDEPTSGLDPHATFELLEMIRGLKKVGRRGAAVLAPARPRAERLRPGGAVQQGQDRPDGHRRRARQPGAGRGPSDPGRGDRHRRAGGAARHRGRAAGRADGAGRLAGGRRSRCARGRGPAHRRGRRRR